MSHKKKRLLKINRCGLSESPAHGVGSFFGARTVIWVKLQTLIRAFIIKFKSSSCVIHAGIRKEKEK
jgi:hypothetical protein